VGQGVPLQFGKHSTPGPEFLPAGDIPGDPVLRDPKDPQSPVLVRIRGQPKLIQVPEGHVFPELSYGNMVMKIDNRQIPGSFLIEAPCQGIPKNPV
jgi:hypothetical protein